MTQPKTPNSRRNPNLTIDRLCAKTDNEPGQRERCGLLLMSWRHKAPPANQQDCRRAQIQGRRIEPLRMSDEEHETPSSAHPPPDTDQVIQVTANWP